MGRRKSSSATSGLAALFILCVASLVLFTIYVKEGDAGPLHTVQLGAAEVLRPVRSVIAVGAGPFQEAGEKIESAFDTSEEEKLQRKLQETQGLAAQASRLERENARLRELLEGERSFYEYGPLARVVAPVGNQFTNRIQIDVGTEDGIKPQMPVVVGENTLVGRTTESVSRSTAQVMLITDREFHAGVRIVPPAEFDPASGQLSPAVTAERVSNALAVAPATSRAMVVLPVPGGPHRMTDDSRSASINVRSGRPAPSRSSWPTTSSRVVGRSRAASGA